MKKIFERFHKMGYDEKLLYTMILMVILSSTTFLTIYVFFAPFLPAMIVHVVYILLNFRLLAHVEKRRYTFVRYAIIISFFVQLTLACFLWFPSSSNYGMFYTLIPVSSFSEMNLTIRKEKQFAIWLSSVSMILYFISMYMAYPYYLYELSDIAVKIISALSIISTILPATVIFYIFAVGLAQKRSELEYLANTDSLTKTANRRNLYIHGERALSDAFEKHSSFSLLVLDIDHFKRVNDTYGHYVGDIVLQEFSDRVRETIRKQDFVARHGGEEFSVILCNTNQETCIKVAEKIRKAISAMPFEIHGHYIKITVSIGVVQYDEHFKNFVEMLNIADHALYEAKRLGRDRTIFMTKEIYDSLHINPVVYEQSVPHNT